jgi:hypothetical protein
MCTYRNYASLPHTDLLRNRQRGPFVCIPHSSVRNYVSFDDSDDSIHAVHTLLSDLSGLERIRDILYGRKFLLRSCAQ